MDSCSINFIPGVFVWMVEQPPRLRLSEHNKTCGGGAPVQSESRM